MEGISNRACSIARCYVYTLLMHFMWSSGIGHRVWSLVYVLFVSP